MLPVNGELSWRRQEEGDLGRGDWRCTGDRDGRGSGPGPCTVSRGPGPNAHDRIAQAALPRAVRRRVVISGSTQHKATMVHSERGTHASNINESMNRSPYERDLKNAKIPKD